MELQTKKKSIILLGLSVLLASGGAICFSYFSTPPKFFAHYFRRKIPFPRSQRFQRAEIGMPAPTSIEKPCADRAGKALLSEASGNCTGNLQVTLQIPTTGLALIYNSMDQEINSGTSTLPSANAIVNRGFGYGWSISGDERFVQVDATHAKLIASDGTPFGFHFETGSSKWIADDARYSQDTIQISSYPVRSDFGGGGALYQHPFSSSPLFQFGLTKIIAVDGSSYTVGREPTTGNVTFVRNDTYNNSVLIGYVGNYAQTIKDTSLSTYSLVYNGGNLQKVVFPSGIEYVFDYYPSTSYLRSYQSNQGFLLTFNYYTKGVIQSLEDNQNHRQEFGYDSDHVSVQSFEKGAITGTYLEEFSSGKIIAVADDGGTTNYVRNDPLGRISNYMDDTGANTVFTYKGTTGLDQHLIDTVTRQDGFSTNFQYFSSGLLKSVTEQFPGSAPLTHSVDRSSLGLIEKVYINGVLTESYGYDPTGNLISAIKDGVTLFSIPVNTPTQIKVDYGANGAVTYNLNAKGFLKSIVTPEGTIGIKPNGIGLPTKVDYPDGSSTINGIDLDGTPLGFTSRGINPNDEDTVVISNPTQTQTAVDFTRTRDGKPEGKLHTIYGQDGFIKKSEVAD